MTPHVRSCVSRTITCGRSLIRWTAACTRVHHACGLNVYRCQGSRDRQAAIGQRHCRSRERICAFTQTRIGGDWNRMASSGSGLPILPVLSMRRSPITTSSSARAVNCTLLVRYHPTRSCLYHDTAAGFGMAMTAQKVSMMRTLEAASMVERLPACHELRRHTGWQTSRRQRRRYHSWILHCAAAAARLDVLQCQRSYVCQVPSGRLCVSVRRARGSVEEVHRQSDGGPSRRLLQGKLRRR